MENMYDFKLLSNVFVCCVGWDILVFFWQFTWSLISPIFFRFQFSNYHLVSAWAAVSGVVDAFGDAITVQGGATDEGAKASCECRWKKRDTKSWKIRMIVFHTFSPKVSQYWTVQNRIWVVLQSSNVKQNSTDMETGYIFFTNCKHLVCCILFNISDITKQCHLIFPPNSVTNRSLQIVVVSSSFMVGSSTGVCSLPRQFRITLTKSVVYLICLFSD